MRYRQRTLLYLVSTLSRSGPINVLREIVRGLDPTRFRAVIATLSAETENTSINELRASGIPEIQLNLSRSGSLLWGPYAVESVVRAVDPDLVHSHGFRADVLVARAHLRCSSVSTLHCDLRRDYQLAYGQSIGRTMAGIEYAALKSLDGVVTVSESVASAALDAGVVTRVIPNGIDLNVYRPPATRDEIRQLRRAFAWPQQATVVLHTGVLIERKDPLGVILAFRASRLAKHGLLVFAGEGLLLERCRRAAGSDANILFLGNRTDVADLLRAANLLVSNSVAEGLPMALLEGCATGIHVLATQIPPHEKIRTMFSRQVRLFTQESSASLREAFNEFDDAQTERLLSPPRSALAGISGRTMSLQYQAFYEAVLLSQSNDSVLNCEAVNDRSSTTRFFDSVSPSKSYEGER
jgi:glycosyltransferase involved in cell wall biosynthesis